MHSGDMSELTEAKLSEAERGALLEVMQKARDFDHQTVQRVTLEGQLSKWTNPLKGWQPRWLKVDTNQNVLHYYVSEDKKRQPPRGSLHLFGAVVSPSEEDSLMFTVSATSGESFKLRAADVKERQFWVSRLRQEVEVCTSSSSSYRGTPTKGQESPIPGTPTTLNESHPVDNSPATSLAPTSTTPTRSLSKRRLPSFSLSRPRKLKDKGKKTLSSGETSQLPGGVVMLEVLSRLHTYHENLIVQLDNYGKAAGIDPLNKDVLLLRATASSAIYSVRDCLSIMNQAHGGKELSKKLSSSAGSLVSPGEPPKATLLRPRSTSDVSDQLDDNEELRGRTVSEGKLPKRSLSAKSGTGARASTEYH